MPRRSMEDRRVADYFVVAGLDPKQQVPLADNSNEGYTKPTLDPITDITVINRTLGEKVPKGYDSIETTPTGLPANLNHASFRCPEIYVCYKRGTDKPPLKDLGVLYEGKERLMEGCEVVHTTMQGHPANVNNGTSSRTYLTYRRADKASPTDTLVVVDICVILGNRGEEPPLTFLKIYKNLNKGMIGSDVFLCYKKAMVKRNVLAYKASILDRYPIEEHDDFPLPPQVPMFCLPMGATVECWSAEAKHPIPNFSTFVLTGAGGEKVYGAAVSFYEEYQEEELTDEQMRSLGLKNKQIREQYHINKTVHVRKSISLLSHWPFFDAFKKFLSQLYKISITGPHTVPLERHISHFMYDVPYPSPERPRILVQLTHDSLSLCMPEDSPLPQSGASFITMLRNLGPEHTMTLLLFVLLENKILLHSLRPTVLTEVAEAVSTMIFPFHWQCPYIPLCPLGLSDVLNAPCPFIVGVDSRYFDLYDPPADVICVDLDTNRIVTPENKKTINYKLLPKRPTRVMHDALIRLYEQASRHSMPKEASDEVSLEMTHVDLEFKRKKLDMQLELSIQEVFLRFTASVLKDYRNYLKPISKQLKTTDASSLFDMQAFAKSMDKPNVKFLTQMMHTQIFFRFIEERSFVSDKDASLAFFDECTEKVEDPEESKSKLIETDNTQTSERTVFIMPPEPVGLPEGVKYSYNGFPSLKMDLFMEANKKTLLTAPTKQPGCPNSPLARRTKQEIKSAQKTASQQLKDPKAWAKCLVSYCYSLWFVVFPAFVHAHPNKQDALKTGFAVLQKMQKEKLKTADELCYRVLMQLAGQYKKPGLAVQVFYEMKRHKVAPNAITYGYYNKVMLEAVWTSPQSKGRLRWTKLRNVIIGVAQFGRAIRRRTQSIYSTNSGSDIDGISHTSADSIEGRTLQLKQGASSKGAQGEGEEELSHIEKENKHASIEESLSTDRGYNSMTQEDAKNLSSQMGGCVEEEGTASPSSPSESQEDSLIPSSTKSRFETWAPMALNFITGYSKPRANSIKSKKDEEEIEDSEFVRPRLGSIVKKASAHTGNISEYDAVKGSLFCNSSGLVIVSQASMQKGHILPQPTSLQSEADAARRRRHKSACDRNASKPSRSMSIFASWKPSKGLITGAADEQKMESLQNDSNHKNDLKLDEGVEDILYPHASALDNVNSDNTNCLLSNDENCAHAKPENVNTQIDSVTSNLGIVLESDDLGTESCTDIVNDTNCSGNTVTTNNAQIETDKVCESSESMYPSNSVVLRKSAVNDTSCDVNNDDEINVKCLSKDKTVSDNQASPATKKREIRRSVSISEDRLSGQFNSDNSAMKQSISESGCALNSTSEDLISELKTPVKQISEDSQSITSLTDKRELAMDFVLRRSQSLKKTNEAIGSFFKYASKAAFTKINEFKQTISQRNGSFGSLGSPSQSVEELDTNDGSSISSTIRERLRFGGSQDLISQSEGSDADRMSNKSENRLSGVSMGSAPSPSFLDSFHEFSLTQTVDSNAGEQKVKIAIEVEMSSCSRCTSPRCGRLIYDEEIMAGWLAEDSNLNTACPYCKTKFVPHLQVYIKDWRNSDKSLVLVGDDASKKDKFHFQDNKTSTPNAKPPMDYKQSSLDKGEVPLTTEEVATTMRRRCTSECLSSLAEDNYGSQSFGLSRSPMSLSIDENSEESFASVRNVLNKDFMTRSASSSEPQVVPYLSPLVLRKELEYILDHEGDCCLASDSFVEDHTIIYWNLVWFFRRIQVTNHLIGFLLTSKAFSFNQGQNAAKSKEIFTQRNILIQPQWDNVRIHDEISLPMYVAWQQGNKTTVLDALVIESASFSRRLMVDIVESIKRNNVAEAIKLVSNGRRRAKNGKCRFRSMYREILFLSFIACKRDNIDHDAFDMEYEAAFNDKLTPLDKRRLQPDDLPKSEYVQCCRRSFSALEI